jgi:tRNA threonylcarbamoyladenosine biosynthesis protein TsaE
LTTLPPIPLADEAATQALGAALAPFVQGGFVMHLCGDLGAGKTTLTRALLRALGITGTLRSPSYALLEPYELPHIAAMGGGTLHHFDFYRLEGDPLAWRGAGFEAAFEAPHAAIVEWPQYAQGLPAPSIRIDLQHCGEQRVALITAADTVGDAQILTTLDIAPNLNTAALTMLAATLSKPQRAQPHD